MLRSREILEHGWELGCHHPCPITADGDIIELKSLRYAITLGEELHFARAAQRHYVSPQPFGRQIQALERELGQRLFERNSRHVSLSPTGTTFLAQAKRLLAALDESVEAVREGRLQTEDHLVVGVLGFGLGDLTPLAMDALAKQLPHVSLSFRELDFLDQHEAVRTGAVDIAIVPVQERVNGFTADILFSVPRVVVVPVRSRWADAGFLNVEELVRQKWLPVSFGSRAEAEWAWPQPHCGSQSAVVTPAAIPAAVALTDTIAFHGAPARTYFPHPGVRFIDCDARGISVAVATRTGDTRQTVTAVRRILTSVATFHPPVPTAHSSAA